MTTNILPNTPEKKPSNSAKILSLKEAPQYRSAVLRLIDAVFPKGAPVQKSMRVEEEFHLLLALENAERTLFVIDESQPKENIPSWPVVASASYRSFEFHFKGRPIPLRAAGIGLVVTSPHAQGRGFGQIIQTEIERRAHQKDRALFTVLWSDLVQFYSKLGYVAAGSEIQWQLDTTEIEAISAKMLEEKDDWSRFIIRPLLNFKSVEKLYTNLNIGPKRDFASYESLLQLPNTYAVGAYQKTTSAITPELKAYAIMGKARDLRDTIHEFIGDPKAFAPLFLQLKEHAVSGLRVYHPAHSPYVPALQHFLGKGTKNPLSFFKVIDGPGIVEWLAAARYLGQGFGIAGSAEGFQLLNRHITFFESHDYGHLLQLFFGPWEISELEDLPPDLKSKAPGLPGPLPIYFWGMDSV